MFVRTVSLLLLTSACVLAAETTTETKTTTNSSTTTKETTNATSQAPLVPLEVVDECAKVKRPEGPTLPPWLKHKEPKSTCVFQRAVGDPTPKQGSYVEGNCDFERCCYFETCNAVFKPVNSSGNTSCIFGPFGFDPYQGTSFENWLKSKDADDCPKKAMEKRESEDVTVTYKDICTPNCMKKFELLDCRQSSNDSSTLSTVQKMDMESCGRKGGFSGITLLRDYKNNNCRLTLECPHYFQMTQMPQMEKKTIKQRSVTLTCWNDEWQFNAVNWADARCY